MTEHSLAPVEHRLSVDEDRCVGHGRCFAVEPELFDSDDAGFPVVLVPTITPDLLARAQAGAAACPEGAVRLDPAPVPAGGTPASHRKSSS